jgi:hypothetical protein
VHFDVKRRVALVEGAVEVTEHGEFYALDIDLDQVGSREVVFQNVLIQPKHRDGELAGLIDGGPDLGGDGGVVGAGTGEEGIEHEIDGAGGIGDAAVEEADGAAGY